MGRGERLSNRRGEPRIVGRTGERIQSVDVLTLDPKSLAAGRQNVDLRRRHEDLRRQRRDRLYEMLAGIEDQKNSLVPQIGDQAWRGVVGLNRQPQHGGERRGDQGGIAQHAKIDEQHGAGEGLDQMMSDRDRDRGFANAANADDGDKARSGQLSRELENVIVAPDHSRSSGRAGWRAENWRQPSIAPCPDRSTVRSGPRSSSPARQGGYVSCAVLSIAQRLAQAGDVKPQTAFFDGDVGPDPSQQIRFADDLVRAGHQRNQNVERSAANSDRHTLFCEKSFACDQAERTKRYCVSGPRRQRNHGVVFHSRLTGTGWILGQRSLARHSDRGYWHPRHAGKLRCRALGVAARGYY